jgi:acyl-coenzyme A synthetase/AMP-(fatty) acid ligase
LAASLNLFALAESLHTGSVLNILPDSHFGEAHEAIVHDGITRMVVDPHKLRVLSETGLAGGVDASGLTSIICAGSKLDARTLDAARRWAPGAAIHEYYGSSELSFVAGLQVLPGEPFPTNSTHVGYPMPGVEIRIVDARGEILADEAIGEIHVRSELTGRKYLWGGTDDVPSADGWWTAGDHGFLRNGALNILGRGADRITSAGHDLFPREIELALASIPGISSAVVAGYSDDFRGQRIVAGIMPACGPVSAMQVRLGMDGLLAATLAPIEYFELVELPVTERGKTSRRTLLQWIHDRDPRARRLA